MLELNNINKRFGGLKAVDDVSLYFTERKISALIGPNGAGKTTIFNIISGFIRPDGGTMLFRSKPLDGLPAWKVASTGIGRMFQDNRVFGKLTCLENVLLAKNGNPGESPLGPFFSSGKVRDFERRNAEEASKWLAFVGLGDKKYAPAENLSYGQQKLLSFARLMADGRELLLLDEPTAGVNPAMIGEILALIKKIVKEAGKTVVIIEHNMSVILEIADFVYFMDDGRVETFGAPKDVLADERVREAYTGL